MRFLSAIWKVPGIVWGGLVAALGAIWSLPGRFWDCLGNNKDQIAALSGIFASLGIIGTALGLWLNLGNLNQAVRSLESTTVYNIQKDGRDLFLTIARNTKVYQYIFDFDPTLNHPDTEYEEAKPSIVALVQYYSTIFNQRQNGVITDRYWAAFSEEMCRNVQLPAVKRFWNDGGSKGSYSAGFRIFVDGCIKGQEKGTQENN